MKSHTSSRFRQLLSQLPPDIQRQAYAAYRLFKKDAYHASLQFKRVGVSNPVYSVRIGKGHRALGIRKLNDQITWFWIGTHAEYDKLVGRF